MPTDSSSRPDGEPDRVRRSRVSGSSRLSTALRARARKPPNRLRSSSIDLWSRLMLVSTATRAVERDRAVAFVDLADEQLGIADQALSERRRGRDEILHHRAVHHRRLAVAGVEDPADHPGDGRLAAGAADRDAALRGVEQLARNCGPGEVGRPSSRARTTSGTVGLDRRRGDQGHARPAAPSRPAGTAGCRASADSRTWRRGGRRRASGRSRRPWRRRGADDRGERSMPLPPMPQNG
jgi:hypothetical protein